MSTTSKFNNLESATQWLNDWNNDFIEFWTAKDPVNNANWKRWGEQAPFFQQGMCNANNRNEAMQNWNALVATGTCKIYILYIN